MYWKEMFSVQIDLNFEKLFWKAIYISENISKLKKSNEKPKIKYVMLRFRIWVLKTILTYHFKRNQKKKTKIKIIFVKKMKIFMPVVGGVGWSGPSRPSVLFFAKFFPKLFQFRLHRAQAPGFAGIIQLYGTDKNLWL